MSKQTWRRLDAGLKPKLSPEALRNWATVAELALKYQLHPDQIYASRKQLLVIARLRFSAAGGAQGMGAARLSCRALRQDWPAGALIGQRLSRARVAQLETKRCV